MDNIAVSELFHSPQGGEHPEKALNPDVITEYYECFQTTSLKFVLNTDEREWDEMDEFISEIEDVSNIPIYVMPVGSTTEDQMSNDIAVISDRATERGYNVSGRMHTYMYGNVVGK